MDDQQSILIIDDDWLRARLIAVSLEEHQGMPETFIVTDGDSALSRIQILAPAVIVLSLNLSRPSGVEFLRILDQDEDGVPGFNVLGLLERGQGELQSAALRFGLRGMLVTPFTPEAVSADIAAALESPA